MRIKILIMLMSVVIFFGQLSAQDNRTAETRKADLLARMPSESTQLTDRLMQEMLSMGESGARDICSGIIPAGTGDDTKSRFAVESMSRYLSKGSQVEEKNKWEKICIDFAINSGDNGVKDFFMKQLQLIGSEKSAEAMKIYLTNKNICQPALGVIIACGGKTAETILAESLKSEDLPCAAAALNALASMKSSIAIDEYIKLASSDDLNIKASAYNAMAMSGHPKALNVLKNAAASVSYRWEHSGATTSLINYARIIGTNGDLKTSDKLCQLVISKCNDVITIQNKTAALDVYVSLHGIDAMPEILKAASHADKRYRIAAMKMSLDIQGDKVTETWTGFFPKAIPEARPEIITMLGVRGSISAQPLIISSLGDQDVNVRSEAAEALVKISKKQALPYLIDYMIKFTTEKDQVSAKKAFMSVAGRDDIGLLKPVLENGSSPVKVSAIELMAWSRGSECFSLIFP